MYGPFKMILAALCAAGCLSQAAVREFRLDQDRLWLVAENEPLHRLLGRFADAGVTVEVDPAVRQIVSGTWRGHDTERALKTLLSPNNYHLDWQREVGPLGPLIRLTGIRVFREGRAAAAKSLRHVRQIETSLDGSLQFMAREILVAFGPSASMDDLRALLARLGGTVIATHPELGIYRILLPEGANVLALLDVLRRDPSIAQAEPNLLYDLPEMLPGDHSSSSAPGQWKAPQGDNPIAVSVLDSGLLPSESLNAAVLSAFDATHPDSPLTADAVGHGTLMAQLAAGLLDPYNSPVGEGVPVVVVKAFADDGMADSFTLMNAMTYAVKTSTGPISLSWGSETPSAFLEAAMNYAASQGRLIFAAPGNENTGRPMYPAAYPNVIGVGAGTEDGQYTDYSNRGDFVDLIAPGSAGGSQGTSVATAYVSHIAAKYQQIHPKASPADITAALKKAAGDDRFLSEEEVRKFLVR